MSKYPVMHHEAMNDLIARYQQTGDQEALTDLIAANEGLIRQIAVRYTLSVGDATLDDLMQWGRMGLVRAVETFDLSRGLRFTTYCYFWIRQHITRYGRQDGQSIRMSVQAHELRARVSKAKAAFEQAHGREPSPSELAECSGVEERKIAPLFRHVTTSLSRDDIHGEEADPMSDKIVAAENTEDEACARADRLFDGRILAYVSHLKENWQRVVVLRYGLDGGEPKSLLEISHEMNLTRERIRQIERQALASLRKTIQSARNAGRIGEF